MCVLCLFTRVQFFATPWTIAHQAPLSMGFSRQDYWSGVAIPFRGSCHFSDQTCISYISCIGRWVLYHKHHLVVLDKNKSKGCFVIFIYLADSGLSCGRWNLHCIMWNLSFFSCSHAHTGLSSCGAWSLEHAGSVVGLCGLICSIRSEAGGILVPWSEIRTHVPCIRRQILNRWTTKEVPKGLFYLWFSSLFASIVWGNYVCESLSRVWPFETP